jgi:hypothetical protein
MAVDASSITESGIPASEAPGVRLIEARDDEIVYRVGAGSYSFSTPWR